MKITKRELKLIIKEEKAKIILEMREQRRLDLIEESMMEKLKKLGTDKMLGMVTKWMKENGEEKAQELIKTLTQKLEDLGAGALETEEAK